VSGLERLWAGWRSTYLDGPPAEGCVFCGLLASGRPDRETYVLWRHPEARAAALLNAYPYGSGHLMVLPTRHAASPEELDPADGAAVWDGVTRAVRAVRAAYRPEGLNVGANLGRAAGAGIPGHFHVHVLPRWAGDTNFMTAVAETRVLPEPLDVSWHKLVEAWPAA
jgi:ATP adenylyltransferase